LIDQYPKAPALERLPALPPALSSLRVAIIHDWFYVRAGAERVVEVLVDIFPQADLFALFARPETMSPELRKRKLTTSWLQKIPFIHRFHRHTLMFHPLALEQFDFSGYDLVISSTSGSVKGILTPPSTLHVCYCYTPMRYIWDMYSSYLHGMSPITRFVFALTAHKIRMWDYIAAGRVDQFACDSHFVASRIKKFYRRTSEVIYPPIDVQSLQIADRQEDYYLALGRLVNYKRFDLAIEACNLLKRPLKIIGTGPELRRLKRIAGPTIEFLGSIPDAQKHAMLAKCRALIFPGEEDFGIVPVEAQAHGRPVIALAAGGALETVVGLDHDTSSCMAPTGVFFREQTAQSLANAIKQFEARSTCFKPELIRDHALQFDTSVFRERMIQFIQHKVNERNGCPQIPIDAIDYRGELVHRA
jgi:glycosyltransferase involved in cell wall biosynthesis